MFAAFPAFLAFVLCTPGLPHAPPLVVDNRGIVLSAQPINPPFYEKGVARFWLQMRNEGDRPIAFCREFSPFYSLEFKAGARGAGGGGEVHQCFSTVVRYQLLQNESFFRLLSISLERGDARVKKLQIGAFVDLLEDSGKRPKDKRWQARLNTTSPIIVSRTAPSNTTKVAERLPMTPPVITMSLRPIEGEFRELQEARFWLTIKNEGDHPVSLWLSFAPTVALASKDRSHRREIPSKPFECNVEECRTKILPNESLSRLLVISLERGDAQLDTVEASVRQRLFDDAGLDVADDKGKPIELTIKTTAPIKVLPANLN